MSVPYIATPEERDLYQAVSDLTLKIARPLIRYNDKKSWPKPLSGGSCFILRFDCGLIGVTANHVVEVFEADREESVSNACLLRTVPFDLLNKIIDRNTALDIATFSVTENELAASEGQALDCRGANWPPPEPLESATISFGGFPEECARPSLPANAVFRAFVSLTYVQDITQREIIATYEPTRDNRVIADERLPDVGANLSGCSGGPVIVHYERNMTHHYQKWSPFFGQGDKLSSGLNEDGFYGQGYAETVCG
ncbi:hypothetical protein, partial [Gluconacetobacter entanii]|uniref:hypothetical protein n=1 Tax=Gluconacetobacter entanii TaxID=108528 RepID=UPI0011B7EE78